MTTKEEFQRIVEKVSADKRCNCSGVKARRDGGLTSLGLGGSILAHVRKKRAIEERYKQDVIALYQLVNRDGDNVDELLTTHRYLLKCLDGLKQYKDDKGHPLFDTYDRLCLAVESMKYFLTKHYREQYDQAFKEEWVET